VKDFNSLKMLGKDSKPAIIEDPLLKMARQFKVAEIASILGSWEVMEISEKEAGKLKKFARVIHEDDDVAADICEESLFNLLIKLWGLESLDGTALVPVNHPHRDVVRYRSNLID
jgi:hypothetical protein